MVHNFTDVIAFIIAICILVAIHEFGHFYIARRCGVKVLRFSIGFGPRLLRWKDKLGTEYAISAIPLGGYVKMLGERDDDLAPEDAEFAHDKKPVYQRMAIAAAGPIANFILAILLYWFIFLQGTAAFKPVIGKIIDESVAQQAGLESGQEIVAIDGKKTATQRDVLLQLMNRLGETGKIAFSVKYPESDFIYESEGLLDKWMQGVEAPNPIEGIGFSFYVPPISQKISSVLPESAAEKAGIAVGDIVISTNGQQFNDGAEWTTFIKQHPEEPLELIVERKGERVLLRLEPTKKTLESGETVGFAGVGLTYEPWPDGMKMVKHHGVLGALVKAGENTWNTAGMALLTLRKLVFGEISVKNLSGPIGIAKVAGDSGRAGIDSFIQFIAYMSILLGVLNLLPVPMLDGGHILFYAVEWIKGGPIPEKIQILGYQAGLVMILGVMVIAFYNDILRL